MQAGPGEIHILRLVGELQSKQDISQTLRVFRPDTLLASSGKEPLKAFMTEAPNHGQTVTSNVIGVKSCSAAGVEVLLCSMHARRIAHPADLIE